MIITDEDEEAQSVTPVGLRGHNEVMVAVMVVVANHPQHNPTLITHERARM